MIALVVLSVADLATTWVLLGRGFLEASPGGAMILEATGYPGIVTAKLIAVAGVYWLVTRRPRVGRPVRTGLAAMTGAAVAWNVGLVLR